MAGIGALWLGFHGVVLVARGTKAYWSIEKSTAAFVSPDGKFKAVVFLDIGDGPATSYCGTSVYVVPATSADSFARGPNNLVYSAPCGGMAEGHWEKNISWKSARVLSVTFDPTMGAAGGELTIRNQVTGVGIEFGFRAGGDSF